jgi:hypothetical protein
MFSGDDFAGQAIPGAKVEIKQITLALKREGLIP